MPNQSTTKHRHVVEPAEDPLDGRQISMGNAIDAGADSAGWFIGGFLPASAGLRRSDVLEMKWGVHRAGEGRGDVSDGNGVQSIAVLISGAFLLRFPDRPEDVRLTKPGDYVAYGPDVPHSWQAIADSTVLTVRWRPAQL